MLRLTSIIFFVAFSSLFYSCKKDDVKSKTCPSGYKGTTCTTPWNSDLDGTWNGKYTSTTGTSGADLTIRIDPNDPKRFYIDHFLDYYSDVGCVMTSESTFEYVNIVTGSGTISQQNTIMTGHFVGGGNGCDYTFTKK